MSDVMVVGYDLAAQTPVELTDQNREAYRSRGYGSRSAEVVCWHCWLGDQAERGTTVPLVVRGRDGGQRRTHFAHPPGMAPVGGHHPETVWHREAKHVLARWAAEHPHVASARLEEWLDDRRRRADVMVTLAGGQRVAVEAQRSEHTDGEWLARHADYRAAGVADVWVWRRTRWGDVARRAGLPVWTFEPTKRKLYTQVADGHYDADAADRRRLHWPACPGDRVDWRDFSLDECTIDATGIRPPSSFILELERAPETEEQRPTRSARKAGPIVRANGQSVARDIIAKVKVERDAHRYLAPEERRELRAREAERLKNLYSRLRSDSPRPMVEKRDD